jgi:O-antigen/teichoic acid export membrane protein
MAALIQALFMLLLLRSVSPEEFGFFAAVYGVITLAQTTLDLGLPTLVIRERAKNAQNGIVASALKLNNVLSLALAGGLVVVFLILGLVVDARFFLLLPLGIWAAAERNADAWLGVVFADGDAKVNTANLISRRLTNLALFLLFLSTGEMDPVLAFGISSAIAAVASWAFAHIYVARQLPEPAPIGPRELVRASWPYWVNSVATQARNLDTAIASILAGTAQAGYYAAAARLTSPLRILPTSLASVLLPASARRTSSSMKSLIFLIGACVAGLGVMYALLALLVPWAVPVFLGEQYVAGIPALQITMVGLIFASAASLLGAPLQGVGLKKYVALIAVVTTVTCLIGVAIGAYLYGAVGAAAGLSVSYLIQSIALLLRLVLFISRKESNQ